MNLEMKHKMYYCKTVYLLKTNWVQIGFSNRANLLIGFASAEAGRISSPQARSVLRLSPSPSSEAEDLFCCCCCCCCCCCWLGGECIWWSSRTSSELVKIPSSRRELLLAIIDEDVELSPELSPENILVLELFRFILESELNTCFLFNIHLNYVGKTKQIKNLPCISIMLYV